MIPFLAMSAPEVFFASANAAYASHISPPPYVMYRVHSRLSALHRDQEFDSEVSVRTKDQVAVVTDGQSREVSLRDPYPAPPTFDPFSTFDWKVTVSFSRRLKTRMTNIVPLRYEHQQSVADVVARTSKDYVIRFAPGSDGADDRIRLVLEPTERMRMRATLWFTDVVIDRATMLPVSATYRQKGQGNAFVTLAIEFRPFAGRLFVSSLRYYATGAALGFGKVTVDLVCDYGAYALPLEPPDPRLSANASASVPVTIASIIAATCSAPRAAVSRTSSCEVGSPAPWTLVISESPATSQPSARAAIASSTVDMPTASAPIVRR